MITTPVINIYLHLLSHIPPNLLYLLSHFPQRLYLTSHLPPLSDTVLYFIITVTGLALLSLKVKLVLQCSEDH